MSTGTTPEPRDAGQVTAAAGWQQLLSALASHRLRELYAAVVLGQQPVMTPKERSRLVGSGLVRDEAGRLLADGEVFKAALAAGRRTEPAGPERFLPDGRIDVLPRRASDRLKVLHYLRDRVIGPDQTLTERELNVRLAEFTNDVPKLRRALVDYRCLDRERDGSAYRRA
ncbi:hypothetical protein D477_010271 [Arthrobacter crystallopoietes BAB-32]|uniref:DUF2087 domain-containing protein n=1 Tax=Arthrobacter crystallopoietes BAB-32 TaxID=1246476 RepID=N1V2X0_9MICC|nr:DUF2087 domain-containing protein [Arthrobacter crystallopoietes]EMY34329.1 hypothetical protein D477_010271 [Arthrobacter crystallopoietes BAB-32]